MDLFNKNSNVRPWLVDSGAKSGSGCWSTELSVGDMLYIEDLEVKEEVCSLGSFILFLFLMPTFWISSSGDAVSARGSSKSS